MKLLELSAVVALLAAPTGIEPARAQDARGLRSGTLRELVRSVEAMGDSVDTGPFWLRMEGRGTPLVEEIQGSDSVLVTFLWRGTAKTRNALVFGDLTGWLPPANETERLPGTDVWFLSVAAPADVRFRYRIAENDSRRIYWRDPDFGTRVQHFRPDPLNPDTVALAQGQDGSWFQGPGFRSGPWTPARAPAGGQWDTLTFGEGARRRVLVYAPPEALGKPEVGVIVALDGGAYNTLVSTPATVERLTKEGALAPVIVALVSHLNRNAELAPNEGIVRFVADTLFPGLEDRWPISADPERSTVVGSSMGGLGALWLAFRLPELLGSAVAQSGAYWWAPPGDDEGPWLSRILAARPLPRLRVYLDAGSLESQPVRGGASMLRLTQQLRDVLCARGDAVAYRTFPAGHMYEGWRETLPGGLTWALTGTPLPEPGHTDACARLVKGAPPTPPRDR